MAMFVVLKGTQWCAMDPEIFHLSAEPEGCCETVCDAIEVNEPFVTIRNGDRNAIYVQSSDIVLMREYTVELPPGSVIPPATDT